MMLKILTVEEQDEVAPTIIYNIVFSAQPGFYTD
jgi:hypothetical protein